jgi:uncharacterized membrane-anchored protein
MSAVLFAILIGSIWATYRLTEAGAITAFWSAYVLTRPLGASLGDLLSQHLGTGLTSLAFLIAILGVVAYLSVTRRDQPTPDATIRARSAW